MDDCGSASLAFEPLDTVRWEVLRLSASEETSEDDLEEMAQRAIRPKLSLTAWSRLPPLWCHLLSSLSRTARQYHRDCGHE
jgi:hypothetical protein